ncbi:hypothetical protein HMPREF1429_01441 [Helicobacter pylori GAM93Bi]|nr:hypothetical protein HMPREF1429_01441 [Helicobacter pylori GAM93Bi]
MEAITLKAYSKGSLKGTMKRSFGIKKTEIPYQTPLNSFHLTGRFHNV